MSNWDCGRSFHPKFTYPFYGSLEKVAVYAGTNIHIIFCSSTMHAFVAVRSIISDATQESTLLNPILNLMGQYEKDWDRFRQLLEDNTFENSISLSITSKIVFGQLFFLKGDISDPIFRAFHSRLQIFLLWYIEGASYLDLSDSKWIVYMVFVSNNFNNGKKHRFEVAGWVTGYRFLAFPDKIRIRLSQFLVLPPFQFKGIGEALYQSFFATFCLNETLVVEMTGKFYHLL